MAIEESMVLYDGCREGFLDGTLDWDADTIVAKLVRSYVPNASAHKYLNDLTGAGAVVAATSAALTGKTTVGGIAKANDIVFTAVPAGAACQGYALVDTTVDVPNGGRLICYIGKDALGALLNIIPNGDDIRIRNGGGTGNIFRL